MCDKELFVAFERSDLGCCEPFAAVREVFYSAFMVLSHGTGTRGDCCKFSLAFIIVTNWVTVYLNGHSLSLPKPEMLK